ncbi:endonuclease VII [Mycobacterium phage Squint]|nr:endonuclease VII [Mycobacterium phage Squint]
MSRMRVSIAYGECPHDDRPRKARGQCNACYLRDLKVRNPETAAKQTQNLANWISKPENRERHNGQRRAARRRKGPDTHRKYGLTRDQYEEYMSRPCGICGEPSVHMDHCHATGKTRGGLCHRCNLGLGYYEGWFTENRDAILAWIERGGVVE